MVGVGVILPGGGGRFVYFLDNNPYKRGVSMVGVGVILPAAALPTPAGLVGVVVT